MSGATTITISGRGIGAQHPCLVIAEIGQAHDGSLGMAHAYIDAVADAGAEAIKFQTHIADAESTPNEKFRVPNFPQDKTRYDYWRRMEFSAEQWSELANHTREKGLIFLSSPFSMEAVELLELLNVPAWKVGSGEIGNLPMIEKICQTGRPVLLSSGMSTWGELDEAIALVRARKAPVAVLQCTTSYPCPAEELGLNILGEMANRYNCPIGLSDHSGSIYASMAAAALGAHLVELHTVFSRECFGPDVSSSVTTEELKQVVEGTRYIHTALGHKIDKDEAAASRRELKKLFGKSLVVARDLPAGHRIEAADITIKKPGTGIPAKRFPELLGRTILRSYTTGEFLEENDID